MHRLISAQTEAEIVAIVRDYLGGWHPRDLAELPAACRPGVIRDGEDLAGLAFALTHCRISNHTEQFAHRQLGEIEAFMAMACARLAEIEARPISHGPSCDPESTPPAQA